MRVIVLQNYENSGYFLSLYVSIILFNVTFMYFPVKYYVKYDWKSQKLLYFCTGQIFLIYLLYL